ncbi:MAG: hypothetical protein ACJAZ3_001990 [Sphingobacteriales bacterium]|jgi:hypothetical protein
MKNIFLPLIFIFIAGIFQNVQAQPPQGEPLVYRQFGCLKVLPNDKYYFYCYDCDGYIRDNGYCNSDVAGQTLRSDCLECVAFGITKPTAFKQLTGRDISNLNYPVYLMNVPQTGIRMFVKEFFIEDVLDDEGNAVKKISFTPLDLESLPF